MWVWEAVGRRVWGGLAMDRQRGLVGTGRNVEMGWQCLLAGEVGDPW